jgi:nucleotide-binding universal stress UspA family protein
MRVSGCSAAGRARYLRLGSAAASVVSAPPTTPSGSRSCCVVRQSSDMTSDASLADLYAGAVVVGFDGSEDSTRAVRWALVEADRRNAPLVVLRAWSLKSAPRPEGSDLSYVPSEDEFSEAVRHELSVDLADALGPDASDALLVAVHRPADEALIAASREALLTVVGARGSGLARWLGSTSTSVVRHAHGPVVVIPQDGERGS